MRYWFRRAIAAAPGAEPNGIATPLALWLEAGSDASRVTLNSGKVEHWLDLSGNGHTFTQSTALLRPYVVTADATFNGLDSIDLQDGPYGFIGPAWSTVFGGVDPYCYMITGALTSPAADSTTPYLDPPVFRDGGDWVGTYAQSSGPTLRPYHYSSAIEQDPQTITSGAAFVLLVRYDGSKLQSALNHGTFGAGDAATNIGGTTGTLRLGTVSASKFGSLKLRQVVGYATAPSDADCYALLARECYKLGI